MIALLIDDVKYLWDFESDDGTESIVTTVSLEQVQVNVFGLMVSSCEFVEKKVNFQDLPEDVKSILLSARAIYFSIFSFTQNLNLN